MSFPVSNSVCIVVLGPYRSGTSVTSRILHRLGVHFGPEGEMFQGDRHNPGGYYERADINRANTEYITSAGGTLADPGSPELLLAKGDVSILRSLRTDWGTGSKLWGIKDPRMCATLKTWLELGLLDSKQTKLVRIKRNAAEIVRSVMEFPHVRDYCDGTPEGARGMVDRYLALAAWQVAHCGLPAFDVEYERLVAEPRPVIESLAAFVGVSDPHLIARAVAEVGKRRGRLRLWTVEYPRRFWRKMLRAAAGDSFSGRGNE